MPEIISDCPRCGAKQITFEMKAASLLGVLYGWQQVFEGFCICRGCGRSTVFVLSQLDPHAEGLGNGILGVKVINHYFKIADFVSLKDNEASPPPTDLPPNIQDVFTEGAKCLAIGCPNAAATMFRLCLDMATKGLLPDDDVAGLNRKIRFSLGLRMEWLFETDRLPMALKDLAGCVKEDGNDGAHEGTLKKDDAEDLRDFAYVLLERLFTEPAKLKQAAERRAARRQQK